MSIDRPLRLVLSCLVLAASSACSSRPDVDPESAPALSTMARTLLASGKSGELPESDWPPGIRELLQPRSIWIHEDGVYIKTSGFFVVEDGVFVPRNPATFAPTAGGDPSYRPVALDVFTYHVAG